MDDVEVALCALYRSRSSSRNSHPGRHSYTHPALCSYMSLRSYRVGWSHSSSDLHTEHGCDQQLL